MCQASKMQPAGLTVFCSPTEQRVNYTDPGHVNCATATTPRQLTDPVHSTDHARYNPRRPDCAGNGSDVTSSRGRPSSTSSSQSVDDVNVPRCSLSSDMSPTYVNRIPAEFDAPASDVTSGHNG